MQLVITEKPSVAQSIAKVLGARRREDGYVEGNGYLVSWSVGHLVELAEPDAYDQNYKKWSKEDLPILPAEWKYKISSATKKQFDILKQLMNRKDVSEVVCATDNGKRENAPEERSSVLEQLKSMPVPELPTKPGRQREERSLE